jgi:hypothetical protein
VIYLTTIYPPVKRAFPVKSPYLKNDAVENFLDGAVGSSTFKCHKVSHLFDKSLSPGGGRGIILSPGFFPNLTSLITNGSVHFNSQTFRADQDRSGLRWVAEKGSGPIRLGLEMNTLFVSAGCGQGQAHRKEK